ncbi:MAG: hypothetical protein AB7Q37_18730 [Pyrinomonadaceae bacterium]
MPLYIPSSSDYKINPVSNNVNGTGGGALPGEGNFALGTAAGTLPESDFNTLIQAQVSTANHDNCIGIGTFEKPALFNGYGDDSIAIGAGATVSGDSEVRATRSMALGAGATVNGPNRIVIGTENETVEIPGILSASSTFKTYTWAEKPNAFDVDTGTIIRILDTWTLPPGLLFISDGANWRPLNGECLLYKWDLAGLSTTNDTGDNVAGFVSPTFPFADLLTISGAMIETRLFAWREDVENTGSLAIGLLDNLGDDVFLNYAPDVTPSESMLRLYGTLARNSGESYGPLTYENPFFLTGLPPYTAPPATDSLVLYAATGGAGEILHFHSIFMKYSA